MRYYIRPKRGEAERLPDDELATDVAIARDLLEHPPVFNAGHPWDTPAAVAAVALEAHLLRDAVLPEEALAFAVDTVLRIGEGEPPPRQFEFEGTYFEQGADRSAARTLPLLLLPVAAALRATVDGQDGSATYERAATAGINLAHAVANEVRLHLARGLDRAWEEPCADGACHHEVALQLAVETMRDCVLGNWDPELGRPRVLLLEEPIGESLAETGDNSILVFRLDAAIRALAPAAMANICVSPRARELLTVLLAAQRRALIGYENDMEDDRGTHALVSARALLTLAASGNDAPIYEHIDSYADNATLLGAFLRALSAAAEEAPHRAATALRIWPNVITHVLALNESGHTPFSGSHYGDMALAALMPNAAYETLYLYREVEDEPIAWWDPVAWQSEVEAWLPVAEGNATCVDQLIGFLGALAPEDQVRTGLPWIVVLVLADPPGIAARSFLLSTWLINMRAHSAEAGALSDWQRVVDALVVAGVSRLASYSE